MMLARVSQAMVSAFERRARVLYGPPCKNVKVVASQVSDQTDHSVVVEDSQQMPIILGGTGKKKGGKR